MPPKRTYTKSFLNHLEDTFLWLNTACEAKDQIIEDKKIANSRWKRRRANIQEGLAVPCYTVQTSAPAVPFPKMIPDSCSLPPQNPALVMGVLLKDNIGAEHFKVDPARFSKKTSLTSLKDKSKTENSTFNLTIFTLFSDVSL
ncbi:hypothetical protein CPB85DRAFT_1445240 [Mucidula mucida]|nr:hypothetical protein CPB85DRAFT_1445240 [Mucidula mucida]